MRPQTGMVDPSVTAGTWLDGTPGTAVMAAHIAEQLGYGVGDTITLELATGPAQWRIVGLHGIHGVTLFVDRRPGRLGRTGVNVIWSDTAVPVLTAGTGR
jgi:hypothetical protein